jgi:peptide deformylase
MTVRKIVTVDDNLDMLRRKASRVPDFRKWLTNLAADMVETMDAYGGVGLSAPQIGQSIQLIVVRANNRKIIAFANPQILQVSSEQTLDVEGCLSIPGYVGVEVPRAARVRIQARNLHGQLTTFWADGYFSRVLQHEIDHLRGVLFTDRIDRTSIRRTTGTSMTAPDEPMKPTEPEPVTEVTPASDLTLITE